MLCTYVFMSICQGQSLALTATTPQKRGARGTSRSPFSKSEVFGLPFPKFMFSLLSVWLSSKSVNVLTKLIKDIKCILTGYVSITVVSRKRLFETR